MDNNQYRYVPAVHLLSKILLFFFVKYYRIKIRAPKEIIRHPGPYLLLSNHIGTFDPFIIGYFLKSRIHYITTYALMRDPFFRFFLKGLGAVPKKKNVRDTRVVRALLSITKGGESVALFPEGTRSWSGTTLHIEPSIAKFAKLLGVPVICAKLKGMFLFNPRWAFRLRRSRVEIEYQIAISKEEISAATEEEIYAKIKDCLWHDEMEYQRKKRHKIHSSRRAEYLGYALFFCPRCKNVGSINSKGNDFECAVCGRKIHVDEYGFFQSLSGEGLEFDNIRDWFDWQEKAFCEHVEHEFEKGTPHALFSDEDMLIFKESNGELALIGQGSMYFFIDRILIEKDDGKKLEFPIESIQTMNPQWHERIEVYYHSEAYRFVGKNKGVSGLKWELATNSIWKKTGQEHKLSTYLKNGQSQ